MKHLLTTSFLMIISGLYAQYQYINLNYNNVFAGISTSGVLFNDPNMNRGVYRIPNPGSQSLIYASSFWFAGKDDNNNLGLASNTYNLDGNDYQPGPYSSTSSYNSQFNSKYNKIWIVSLDEVNNHIQNWNNPDYITPLNIANWPGNGDTTLGVAYHLAPFEDLNQNGKYEPDLGEYPSLKECEHVIYMILNDDKIHLASTAVRMGIEVHYTIYQYATSNFLHNTTLLDVVVYNRSNKNWSDFKIGMFLDPDLGYNLDDYVGCNPSKNLTFAYNADNFDETNGSIIGYGNNPPSFGVISLNKDLSTFISFGETGQGSIPITPSAFWNNLNGLYENGSPILNNSGSPTTLMFNEDPNIEDSESEYQLGNATSDRRVVSAYNMENLPAGSSQKLSLAIIYARTGDQLQNVTELFSIADNIQLLYDNETIGCNTELPEDLSISETNLQQLLVFPNPTDNDVTIKFQEKEEGTIQVYSLDGSEMVKTTILGIETTINTENLSEGIYFLDVTTKTNKYKRLKLVVTH